MEAGNQPLLRYTSYASPQAPKTPDAAGKDNPNGQASAAPLPSIGRCLALKTDVPPRTAPMRPTPIPAHRKYRISQHQGTGLPY